MLQTIVPGQQTTTCTISADGGRVEPVTSGQFFQMNPSWSPDGASLIFSAAPGLAPSAKASGVFIVNLHSRQMRKVPGSEGFFAPEISPEGRDIVAKSSRSAHTMLFDSGTALWTELPGVGKSIMRWSRDGKYIYSMRSGKDPAVMRLHLSDRRVEVVASLDGVRQTGTLPGISFTLDPDESPVILRDVGVQEIYSLAWKAH